MKKFYRTMYLLVFLVYLAVLIYFTIFAEALGRIPGTEAGNPANYNLVPFTEIRRYIVYREQLGINAVVLNIFGNLAAFIPAGILIPLISDKPGSIFRAVGGGFLISLMIECTQFIFKVGSFDVDDMILNTLGVLAGFLLLGLVTGGSDVS